jgi:hypothetical protein
MDENPYKAPDEDERGPKRRSGRIVVKLLFLASAAILAFLIPIVVAWLLIQANGFRSSFN